MAADTPRVRSVNGRAPFTFVERIESGDPKVAKAAVEEAVDHYVARNLEPVAFLKLAQKSRANSHYLFAASAVFRRQGNIIDSDKLWNEAMGTKLPSNSFMKPISPAKYGKTNTGVVPRACFETALEAFGDDPNALTHMYLFADKPVKAVESALSATDPRMTTALLRHIGETIGHKQTLEIYKDIQDGALDLNTGIVHATSAEDLALGG